MDNNTKLAILEEKTKNIQERIAHCDEEFVSQDRFNPIEKIVWALTIAIITGVIGLLLSLLSA